MNTIATIAGLAVAASAMTASADVLLEVDLSVADQVTITATNGLSSSDASTSNFTGFLLADIFTADGALGDTLVSGDLVSASETSDGTPSIFRAGGGTDAGLNLWSLVDGGSAMNFTNGMVAFTGSATWDISAAGYAAFAAAPATGDIYAGVDNSDDIVSDGVLIGQWSIVPAPGSAALLGLGGLVAVRRRR